MKKTHFIYTLIIMSILFLIAVVPLIAMVVIINHVKNGEENQGNFVFIILLIFAVALSFYLLPVLIKESVRYFKHKKLGFFLPFISGVISVNLLIYTFSELKAFSSGRLLILIPVVIFLGYVVVDVLYRVKIKEEKDRIYE